MRPNTRTLLLPSKVSSPTPLCPVKTDCLLTLLVRGNVLFQFGELRSWIQAEQLEVDCQLHLSAMSPWTSHRTSLGPVFLQNGHQSEAHPWVVQNSLFHGKAMLECKQPSQRGTTITVTFKQLRSFRKTGPSHYPSSTSTSPGTSLYPHSGYGECWRR